MAKQTKTSSMPIPPKGTREAFARFAEDPSREKFRDLLRDHLGEARNLDFKEHWPDHPSLAKQILGLGNTDGGALVIGVKEEDTGELNPVGLTEMLDKADLISGIKKYLPSELLSRIHPMDFSYQDSEYSKIVGRSYQVLLIEFSPEHTPFISTRAGSGLRDNSIYVRRDGLTEEASHAEVQSLLNRRIETQYSSARELTLKKHVEQLKALYAEIPQFQPGAGLLGLPNLTTRWLQGSKNNLYPSESVDQFLVRMIGAKKKRIEIELDLET